MSEQPTTLAPFYRGWEDYQNLLIKAIAPLTDEQLAGMDPPQQRPIWLIAAHIIGTRVGWLMRIDEVEERYLPYDEWDADGARPRSAAELVEGLEATWEMLAARLGRWTTAMLEDEFTYQRASGPATRTRQWVIWHLIEHDLHHGGEISLTLGSRGLTGLDL